MFKKHMLFGLVIACSSPALAQQSAHVHGIASMNLAIDGDELEIEFVSPADGIVGFEYEPSNAAEKKAVKDAIALLRDPATLFVLPGNADCHLHEVEVGRHAEDDHGHDEHDHDDKHDEHAHDEHELEEHAHKDEHDHDDHGHGDKEDMHSEFHAHYHFDCEGAAIKEIQLTVFKNWPRIETLQLQALTPNGQTGGNINASNPVIRLP